MVAIRCIRAEHYLLIVAVELYHSLSRVNTSNMKFTKVNNTEHVVTKWLYIIMNFVVFAHLYSDWEDRKRYWCDEIIVLAITKTESWEWAAKGRQQVSHTCHQQTYELCKKIGNQSSCRCALPTTNFTYRAVYFYCRISCVFNVAPLFWKLHIK